ncbi:MAG: Tpl protein [Candidatus Cloacimonetes bacterium]|jgi:cell fate regulator YaaT (PSP1 superfamily)|nr:Tpl protein [Candidatus Cloacimonadota bacterium]MBT4575511.1 Tpl protein [Candidatus Cloacimonadota bacterium]
MQEYIKVVFRTGREGYYLNNKEYSIEPDIDVIVKVERGEDVARILNCAVESKQICNKIDSKDISSIKRIATEADLKQLEVVKKKEQETEKKFLEMLKKQPFTMKLLQTIYQLDGNKLTFFFSADGRIDFRDFVRELASEFKTRIELHQTSGREDARRLGGLGMCGKTYCCVTFLRKFNQVTIQMAKDQNLLSNLSKISGPCGRLLCCLHYEEEFYLKKSEDFPELGQVVRFKDQKMYVEKNDYYNNRINLIAEDHERFIVTLEEFKEIEQQNEKKRS